jgi:hypothetical protein
MSENNFPFAQRYTVNGDESRPATPTTPHSHSSRSSRFHEDLDDNNDASDHEQHRLIGSDECMCDDCLLRQENAAKEAVKKWKGKGKEKESSESLDEETRGRARTRYEEAIRRAARSREEESAKEAVKKWKGKGKEREVVAEETRGKATTWPRENAAKEAIKGKEKEVVTEETRGRARTRSLEAIRRAARSREKGKGKGKEKERSMSLDEETRGRAKTRYAEDIRRTTFAMYREATKRLVEDSRRAANHPCHCGNSRCGAGSGSNQTENLVEQVADRAPTQVPEAGPGKESSPTMSWLSSGSSEDDIVLGKIETRQISSSERFSSVGKKIGKSIAPTVTKGASACKRVWRRNTLSKFKGPTTGGAGDDHDGNMVGRGFFPLIDLMPRRCRGSSRHSDVAEVQPVREEIEDVSNGGKVDCRTGANRDPAKGFFEPLQGPGHGPRIHTVSLIEGSYRNLVAEAQMEYVRRQLRLQQLRLPLQQPRATQGVSQEQATGSFEQPRGNAVASSSESERQGEEVLDPDGEVMHLCSNQAVHGSPSRSPWRRATELPRAEDLPRWPEDSTVLPGLNGNGPVVNSPKPPGKRKSKWDKWFGWFRKGANTPSSKDD